MSIGRLAASRAIFVATLCSTAMAASIAHAGPESLREGLFGARPTEGPRGAPDVARYISEEGQTFVLDLSQRRPLLKFENSPEVWALQPQPGPRGDTIYKNDQGEAMLRATRLGGVTVFTDTRPGGSAAALAGAGAPIRLAPLGPQALLERLAQASARASRAARRLIPFEADASPGSSALIADAAGVTAQAVVRITRRNDGGRVLARFSKVRLVEGKRPAAAIQDGVLRVTVSPGDGLAGRPSSDRIVAVALSR